MNANASGVWWLVVIVTGAVGTAMALYGMRQKEPMPLVFGVIIGVIPMVIKSGWAAAGVSVGVGVLYYVIRQYS